MRLVILICLAIILSVADGSPTGTELITVPVESSATVENDDYYQAKNAAMELAFQSAIQLAVSGIMKPAELERNKILVETRLLIRSSDFVSSYKFLDEKVDQDTKMVTLQMQVTLYLDAIRAALDDAGVMTKRRDLPKLLILIKEQSAGFATDDNFLMLTSLSEEILVTDFRNKGYLVVDRSDVRSANMEAEALKALAGDRTAAARVGRFLQADILVIGKTRIDATRSSSGELITAITDIVLRGMPKGRALYSISQRAEVLHSDILSGSMQSIQAAVKKLSKDLAATIPGKWESARNM